MYIYIYMSRHYKLPCNYMQSGFVNMGLLQRMTTLIINNHPFNNYSLLHHYPLFLCLNCFLNAFTLTLLKGQNNTVIVWLSVCLHVWCTPPDYRAGYRIGFYLKHKSTQLFNNNLKSFKRQTNTI